MEGELFRKRWAACRAWAYIFAAYRECNDGGVAAAEAGVEAFAEAGEWVIAARLSSLR